MDPLQTPPHSVTFVTKKMVVFFKASLICIQFVFSQEYASESHSLDLRFTLGIST